MKVNVTCSHCSKNFLKDDYTIKTEKVFCSRECFNKGRTLRTSTKMVEFKCENCGKTQKQYPSQYNSNEHHFCNRSCRKTWLKSTGALSGENNPAYQGAAKMVECHVCQKLALKSALQQRSNEHSFCSHRCYGIWRKGRFAGPESPSWTGGEKYYRGPNWRGQSLACRTRDNFKCRSCGKSKYIHAHHIKPFRDFGYNRDKGGDEYISANRLENLITLYPSCHRKVERGSLCLIKP